VLPQDDYNLACLLKSPIVGLTEEDLQELCVGRTSSLWKHLQEHPSYHSVAQQLRRYRSWKKFSDPIALLDRLQTEKSQEFQEAFGQFGFDELQNGIREFLLEWGAKHPFSLDLLLDFWKTEPQTLSLTSSVEPAVQMRTIHGAKGLQFPIVLLVDDGMGVSLQKEDWLVQPNGSRLIKPSQKMDTEQTRRWKHKALQQLKKEHRRLLYVALTRAETQLFILTPQEAHPQSWGGILTKTFERIGQPLPPSSNGFISGWFVGANAVSSPPMISDKKPTKDWLLPEIPPTRSVETHRAPNVPVSVSAEQERGLHVHRIFEKLSTAESLPEFLETWETEFKQPFSPLLLNHPFFSDLIRGEAFNELELAHKGQLLQIDRLVLTETWIGIVEYKTGTPHPRYGHQMQFYQQAVQALYPNHQIEGLFVWIDQETIEKV
jgi:ATP-dependent helicase/nuclease subunit A